MGVVSFFGAMEDCYCQIVLGHNDQTTKDCWSDQSKYVDKSDQVEI